MTQHRDCPLYVTLHMTVFTMASKLATTIVETDWSHALGTVWLFCLSHMLVLQALLWVICNANLVHTDCVACGRMSLQRVSTSNCSFQIGMALQVVGRLQAYIKLTSAEKALIASNDAASAATRSSKRVAALHNRLQALSQALLADEEPRGAVVAVVKKVQAVCKAVPCLVCACNMSQKHNFACLNLSCDTD